MEKLTGNEVLLNTGEFLQNARILHFWRWAFSDLKMNDIRGKFAEWLVAKLLDISLDVRGSWDECDLVKDGVRIEVKSSAYLQSWRQNKPSKIVFSGLKGRKLEKLTNKYHDEQTYNADLYVFCVQNETDASKWNALDLDQWDFYLVKRKELEKIGQKTISIGPLAKLCPKINAKEFCEYGRTEIVKLK